LAIDDCCVRDYYVCCLSCVVIILASYLFSDLFYFEGEGMSNLISMDKKYKTRDGRDVRILCVDANGKYSVVALVEGCVVTCTKYGAACEGEENYRDLIEQPEEKTVWLEIFRYTHWSKDAKDMVNVHNSRKGLEAAVLKQQFGYQCIVIKKITYVEGEGLDG
jgi:hypothetical protein